MEFAQVVTDAAAGAYVPSLAGLMARATSETLLVDVAGYLARAADVPASDSITHGMVAHHRVVEACASGDFQAAIGQARRC